VVASLAGRAIRVRVIGWLSTDATWQGTRETTLSQGDVEDEVWPSPTVPPKAARGDDGCDSRPVESGRTEKGMRLRGFGQDPFHRYLASHRFLSLRRVVGSHRSHLPRSTRRQCRRRR